MPDRMSAIFFMVFSIQSIPDFQKVGCEGGQVLLRSESRKAVKRALSIHDWGSPEGASKTSEHFHSAATLTRPSQVRGSG